MPFLGRDWRSPGQRWIRTSGGWQRFTPADFTEANKSPIATNNKNSKIARESIHQDGPQPHMFIQTNRHVDITEAFRRLEFDDAAKDVRRFNYTCKVLELLLLHRLSGLSGTAQRLAFDVLAEIVRFVVATHNNIHVALHLLKGARVSLEKGRGSHVGGVKLWKGHFDMIDIMLDALENMELKQREEDGGVMISDLPDECLRQIFNGFTKHNDILNFGATETRMLALSQERNLWKDLCFYHFSQEQMKVFAYQESINTVGPALLQKMYTNMLNKFGPLESYGETLHLCRHCSALYWGQHGHPCLVQDVEPDSVEINPEMCIWYFLS